MTDKSKEEDLLLKAEVGDIHPNKPYIYVEYKPGKFDWRNMNTGKGKALYEELHGSGKDGGSGSAPKTPSRPTPNQINAAKARSGGNKMSGDKLKTWAKTAAEADLVKLSNGGNVDAATRLASYNELKDRGYDVTRINTAGGLDKLMGMTAKTTQTAKPSSDTATAKTPKAPKAPKDARVNNDDDEDMAAARALVSEILDQSDFDEDSVTESWYLDKSDPRVKALFKLKTKAGRIKYDIFIDAMKRKEPDYENPIEVVQGLNSQYLEFLENPHQRFMISAGGAGIGKTYGFKTMAELLNIPPFDETHNPGDSDYGYFEAPDVKSGPQLLDILKAHNGKVILFDDNDSVLTRKDCSAIMKKATADSKKRIIEDPDDKTKNIEFTGRIIIMSNKDMGALSAVNEDTKAVLSRAMMKSEIYLTVDETIEAITQRFQDYEFTSAPRLEDPKEDAAERQALLDMMVKYKNNIDPDKFTVRSFAEMINAKRSVERSNKRRVNSQFQNSIGSKDKDWAPVAAKVITKAENYEGVEVGSHETFEKAKSFDDERAKRFARADDDGVDYSIDEEENIIKADSDIFFEGIEMDINKAEDLLLN